LSLICSALTWLRNHKRTQYEASFSSVAEGMKDEPRWLVEQTLRRKREELTARWKEREARLEQMRAKEKMMEARGAKRRRVDRPSTKVKAEDEEAEFLIDDWSEEAAVDNDPLSTFSKETRELMQKAGLVVLSKGEAEEEVDEDEIKVTDHRLLHSVLG
jgi:chromosome transmission fidelity protein 1